jgi:hypothetical protein
MNRNYSFKTTFRRIINLLIDLLVYLYIYKNYFFKIKLNKTYFWLKNILKLKKIFILFHTFFFLKKKKK